MTLIISSRFSPEEIKNLFFLPNILEIHHDMSSTFTFFFFHLKSPMLVRGKNWTVDSIIWGKNKDEIVKGEEKGIERGINYQICLGNLWKLLMLLHNFNVTVFEASFLPLDLN